MLGMDQTECVLQMDVKIDRMLQLVLDNCRSIKVFRIHQ